MRTYGQFSWSTTIRDKISAAPPRCSPDTRPEREIVYPENNGEVMPRLCLGWELIMVTIRIYASSGCPNNVDNSKEIQLQICKDPHISIVSLPNGRRLTRLWFHNLRTLSITGAVALLTEGRRCSR